jgi:hypothetical protein
VIELVRLDGSRRYTIELPFFALNGNSLAILPGAKQLVVTERPPQNGNAAVYLVDAETSAVKKLFDYSAQGRPPELVVSPDGQTLLAQVTESLTPSVSAIDLTRIR